MSDLIRYQTAGPVARITLARPERRNALNGPLLMQLSEAVDTANEDSDVRVIVLTGEGSTFSAGADLEALKHMQSASAMDNLEDSRRLAALFHQITVSPKPLVARINGHAIAGGCGLASICDISIAAGHARFGFTEVRIGFVPAIVMVFVLQKVGSAAARHLLLTGEVITARRAADIGLISEVADEAMLDERVEAIAKTIASETSPSAVALTRQMMARLPGMGLDDALEYAAQMNAFARGTDDCRAGIEAFLTKSSPPWKR